MFVTKCLSQKLVDVQDLSFFAIVSKVSREGASDAYGNQYSNEKNCTPLLFVQVVSFAQISQQ